jgi:phage baseplate assembly protein W
MPSTTKKYSDFDLSFLPHPVTGDVSILRDVEAVKRSLRNLLYMGRFDRPFEPDIGANLRQLLFEDINPLTEKSIDMQIRGAISRYEPRATVVDLKVTGSPDRNGYEVYLTFVVDTLSTMESISTFMERIR